MMIADFVMTLLLVMSFSLLQVTASQYCERPWILLGSSCMRVVIVQDRNNTIPGSPVTWQQARQQCQQMAPGHADLAVTADDRTLADFSRFVRTAYPDETTGGWVYWVGGQKVISGGKARWQWVNGNQLDVTSNLWLPSSPAVNDQEAFAKLVPADKTHGRFYIMDERVEVTAPAFVCQLL